MKNHTVTYFIGVREFTYDIQSIRETFGKESLSMNNDKGITDMEAITAMELWATQLLNPYLDGYWVSRFDTLTKRNLLKYCVGYHVFLSKADQQPQYDGFEQELTYDKTGRAVIKVKTLVFRKDKGHPISWTVDFEEFAQRKGDGSLTRMWKEKGNFMICKCGLAVTMRMAFPQPLNKLYLIEEFQNDEVATPKKEKTTRVVPPVKKEVPVADKAIVDDLWGRLEDAEGIEDLKNIARDIKTKHQNLSDLDRAALLDKYNTQYAKFKEEKELAESTTRLKDFEAMEKVLSMLSGYDPAQRDEIDTIIETIEDEGIKSEMKEAQRNYDKTKTV